MICEDDIIIPDTRYIPIIVECINNLTQWGFDFDYLSIKWDIQKMDPLGLTSWKTIDGVLDTTIYLNQGLITQDISIIKDTVYHEIAHVLAGPNVGHGPKWLNIVSFISKKTGLPMQVTQKSESLENEYFLQGHKYALICEKCGRIIGFEEMTDFVKNPRSFDKEHNCYRYTHTGCGGVFKRIK